MIPGNIDLTENLDFRRVVQKEIPQLPDNWKKNEIITDTKNITSITNTSTVSYNSSNSTYSVRNYYYEEEYTTLSWSNDFITTINSPDISDWSVTYNLITNSTISNVTMTIDDNTYIGGNNYLITKKKEYDIFGNEKINYVEEIPSIPWSSKERKKSIRDIPWKTYKEYGHWKLEEPSIPWDTTPDWDDMTRVKLDTVVRRAKNLICWLSDKTNRFIESYLNKEEEDNLSYLTNMSWIRVREAVIDTV